ncbi:carboxypeptidase regulatory-like domain-containing protein [Mucilaginibacter gotjawali]|uniref:Uncharacterized protein n=2 Tax=Mucilaginibacter gotjawali TaxID=1550579 RepID=A0A0X8X4U3_9SPHI|nr:carboxypeptidase regulatory-like domain-containing protein [Mucilaginibacter gotjawali]MBB3058501.1 hypothetical protein [Mucilaginibacter gotjawali]BAU55725.1 hypothetical protein MgSA37_03917 [Mucilaginibacter gotjawali]
MSLFTSCNEIIGSEWSRVVDFQYTGNGDSIYTILYGKVFEINKIDNIGDTIPVSGAAIKAEQNGTVVKTDLKGSFSIEPGKGTFTLTIAKPGYQTLQMTNYISDPDRVSNTAIVLVKGSGINRFEIPAPAAR